MGMRLDPRTKILLLILCVISAMTAPSLEYNCLLVGFIGICGIISGRWRYSVKAMVIYAVVYLFTKWVLTSFHGTWQTMLIAFLGLFHKVYPCGIVSAIFIKTTKIGEFISAMNLIHIPQKLVISLAVMLRYIPTIKEDWLYINAAMKMRGISPTVKNFLTRPGLTVECIYVPLMMMASKAADELTIAAVTRGIESPNQRTCLMELKFKLVDLFMLLAFLGILLLGQMWKGGFL